MIFLLSNSAYFVNLHVHFLFYLTFFYILGIASYALGFFGAAIIVTAIVTLYTSYAIPYHRAIALGCTVCLLLGGILLYKQREAHAKFYDYIDNKTFTVKGSVSSIAPFDHRQFRYCMSVCVTHMQQQDSDRWDVVDKTINLYIKKKPAIRVADTVQIQNLPFKKVRGDSFNDYAIKEGIAATLFLQDIEYTLIERPMYSYSRWLFYMRESLVNSIRAKTETTTFNLFTVLFLGKHTAKSDSKESMKDNFAAWGLTHYLARSGLHMVIFVLIWHMLLNVLPIAYLAKELSLFALGLWYYALSWPSISFNRAFSTFLLQKTCSIFFVRTDLLHLLTIVCLITLLGNPSQLFFLDFQLSFGLTFALALMNRVTTYQRVASQQNSDCE